MNPLRCSTLVAAIWTLFLSVSPAQAQIDLSGNWNALRHEDWLDRDPGPEAVEYLGLPLNDEARARALEYSSSALSLPERQCLYYSPPYLVLGPFGMNIWSETNPATGEVIAWRIGAAVDRASFTIWMDGREAPPEGALHTFGGFTTGRWEGSTLRTRTIDFKEGYLRRNGVPHSDRATLDMTFKRHGDLLTLTAFIQDPVYLTEPLVLSRNFQINPSAPGNRTPGPCVPQAELPSLTGASVVPHHLPGQNPALMDVTRMYNLPLEAVMGGAETMYPAFRDRLRGTYTAPDRCQRYCCGWEDNMTGFPSCPSRAPRAPVTPTAPAAPAAPAALTTPAIPPARR